jgi:pimeloyl-ACP methyl ester carboxylesterase
MLRFTGAEGNRLAADSYGDPSGPLVLLMHGGGQTRHSWWRTAEALAGRGYHAVTFDHRGHGESDWVDSRRYELPDFAADLRAVVDQLGPVPLILVGASLGGLTAMTAVGSGLGPEAVGIVLADVAHRANPTGGAQLRGFMENDPDGYDSVEAAAAAIERHMPQRGGRRNVDGLRRNLRQRPDGRWIWHWDPVFMQGRKQGGQRFGDGSPELFAAIRAIDVPLLLARGQRSEIVSPEIAAEFGALLPSAEVVELAGVGHMVAGDDNAPFTRALVDFLERNIPGKAS